MADVTNQNKDELTVQLETLNSRMNEIISVLRQIEGALRIVAAPISSKTMTKIFKNRQQLKAYEQSNGENSTRAIGALVGVDQKTISRWWRDWEENYRIVEKVGTRGQYKKIYSLAELAVIFYDLTEEPPST